MYRVIKRDNSIVDFNLSKIKDAMSLAFQSRQKPCHPDVLDLLALKVTADFSSKVKDELVNVEDIQDSVESVLIQAGYADVAKAYILYRRQREKLRNMKNTFLDYRDTVNKYLNVTDWRVKENSTVTYSVGGLILSNSGAITANYWLSEVYDDEIANAHRTCEFHLHDLSMLTGYCAGWSLRQLIEEGLSGVAGKITSSPAKHLSTLCNQMVNFLGIMQNEWAGAQADEIAQGLAGMVHIFNPQLILIGGGVSAQQKLLIEPIAAKVKASVMPAFAEGLEVRAAQLHNDAGMVGAVYYFRQTMEKE